MSLFGEVLNPGTGRNNDARTLPMKFIKVGAAVVGLLIAAVIFFNYVASVTRIGAGYVGVEIVLSGFSARSFGDSDTDRMGLLQSVAEPDH